MQVRSRMPFVRVAQLDQSATVRRWRSQVQFLPWTPFFAPVPQQQQGEFRKLVIVGASPTRGSIPWWSWCKSSIVPCEGAGDGANPFGHPNLDQACGRSGSSPDWYPAKAAHDTQNWHGDLYNAAQLALRAVVGGFAVETLLNQRFEVGAQLLARVQPVAAKIGRASCRERVCLVCRSRWSPYH